VFVRYIHLLPFLIRNANESVEIYFVYIVILITYSMLSRMFTISNLVDTRSNKSTAEILIDKNEDEQQASPYYLYYQLRQQEKRRQSSISSRGTLLNLCRGIIARLLLIIVLIYLYVTAYCINEQDNKYIWLLSFLSILILIEGFIAIRYQQGKHEWYWYVFQFTI
jgi:hypothetical protein